MIKNIRNLFEHEKEQENHYKPVRIGKLWSNNFGDKNKILTAKEYLNKIKTYLKDIINDLKKSDT